MTNWGITGVIFIISGVFAAIYSASFKISKSVQIQDPFTGKHEWIEQLDPKALADAGIWSTASNECLLIGFICIAVNAILLEIRKSRQIMQPSSSNKDVPKSELENWVAATPGKSLNDFYQKRNNTPL